MFRNYIRKLMIGRYGQDHLNAAMVLLSLAFFILASLIGIGLMLSVSYLLIALSLFRMLSRNISRRRAENDKFIRYWWPIRTTLVNKLRAFKQRKTHKFIKCLGCRYRLRIPKRKGKLQITCPKCGERFLKRT